MPSPFPGMNPYLENEDVFHGFHKQFCPACAETITGQVRPTYIVRLIQHDCVHERESFIQIMKRESRQVVTIIELLNLSRKTGGADEQHYRTERQQWIRSPVHLVEIDLLRGGSRLLMGSLPPCDYCVVISQGDKRPEAFLWPIGLRDRLPVVLVPLTDGDPPAVLDLQALLHRVYDSAGFDDYIYACTPWPALSSADALWAREVLAQRPA